MTTNEKGSNLDEFDCNMSARHHQREKLLLLDITDEKEYKVISGAEGSKINLQDEPIAADFSITAKKVIAEIKPVA